MIRTLALATLTLTLATSLIAQNSDTSKATKNEQITYGSNVTCSAPSGEKAQPECKGGLAVSGDTIGTITIDHLPASPRRVRIHAGTFTSEATTNGETTIQIPVHTRRTFWKTYSVEPGQPTAPYTVILGPIPAQV